MIIYSQNYIKNLHDTDNKGFCFQQHVKDPRIICKSQNLFHANIILQHQGMIFTRPVLPKSAQELDR